MTQIGELEQQSDTLGAEMTPELQQKLKQDLGLSVADIDTSYRPPVCTASRGMIQSDGYVRTKLYLKDHQSRFLFLNVSFLVIASDNLPPLVLGHGKMLSGKFMLGHLHDTPFSQYALHISAYLPGAKQPHRAIISVIKAESAELVNVNFVLAPTNGEECNIVFHTETPLLNRPDTEFNV